MGEVIYIVRKGSPVWVCKGNLPYEDKPYKLISHTMKRDMVFPPSKNPATTGPGVIAIASLLPIVIEHKQRHFSECFVETDMPEDPLWPAKMSFLDLLEKGMNLFTTGVDEYPVIAVFKHYVDEVEVPREDKWHVEDLGDGLRSITLNPKTFHGAGHPAWEEQPR